MSNERKVGFVNKANLNLLSLKLKKVVHNATNQGKFANFLFPKKHTMNKGKQKAFFEEFGSLEQSLSEEHASTFQDLLEYENWLGKNGSSRN